MYTLAVQEGFKYILRSDFGVFLGFSGEESTFTHFKDLPNVKLVGIERETTVKYAPYISELQLQSLLTTIKYLNCNSQDCFDYMFNIGTSGKTNVERAFEQVHYLYHYSDKTYGNYSTDMVLQYHEPIIRYQNCIDFAKATFSLATLPELTWLLERKGTLQSTPTTHIDFSISRFANILALKEDEVSGQETDFESFYPPIKEGTATRNRSQRRSIKRANKQKTILDDTTLPAVVIHGLLLNMYLSLPYYTKFTIRPPKSLYTLIIESIFDDEKRKQVAKELGKLGAPTYWGR